MKKLLYVLVLITGIANAQIVNIPDSNFKAKLISIGVDTNSDGEIQESEALSADTFMSIESSDISSLQGIEAFGNLIFLSCVNNHLTDLDLTALTNLQTVYCAGNQLVSLNVNGLTNLITIYCDQNLLTTIDCSSNINLQQLSCADNLLLESVIIKNGLVQETIVGDFIGCENLQFICADQDEIANVISSLNIAGLFSVSVSSYCSFTPGGNYNTITGTTTYDANNDGCDTSDGVQTNIKIKLETSTDTEASFTSDSSNYIFYTQAGSFNVTPNVENPFWFTFTPPSATILFANSDNNTATQNFCITANGIHPDLEVVIAPITPARPGFDAKYKIVYKNKGNQVLSGSVSFSYNDAVLDFVSSDVAPTQQSTGLLSYDYTNLLPFENRSIYITLSVNTPTDTPAVNIGDVLSFTATINPIAGDETPSDNIFQYDQTVVGSFDPNDVTCIEGNMVAPSEIGKYLHYVINFENTGTAAAENIVVRDTVDTNQYDIDSFQLLNSSAPVTARLTGNVAEFIFPNINLHSGGHGNILIKIKSKDTLVQGDSVNKKASIYFDYNAPVDTNLENTIFQALSNPDIAIDASISVYPNPTKGKVNINCTNNIESVQLFDVQGRLLENHLIDQTNTVIDIAGNAKGIYFVQVKSDKGIVVQKIVKE